MDIFNNRLALITGGSSGIGLSVGKLLAQKGANVWLLARRKEQLLSALALLEKVRISPVQNFGVISADVTDFGKVDLEVSELYNKQGTPDFLINSAGIVRPGEFHSLDLKHIHQMMDFNYFGTVNCIKAVLPKMLERKSGHIVNISSMAGFLGVYGYSGYCASKFAVKGLSDVLRSELKFSNIRLSIVFPPDTETPQLEHDRKYKPPITHELTSSGGLMMPDQVAESIIRGIQKNKYIITPGFESSFAYIIQGFTGNLSYWVFDKLVEKARRKIEGKQSKI